VDEVKEAITQIVNLLEITTEDMSTIQYKEVLKGLIEEFQQRHDVAEQEASS
jgi:hypothetical protein